MMDGSYTYYNVEQLKRELNKRGTCCAGYATMLDILNENTTGKIDRCDFINRSAIRADSDKVYHEASSVVSACQPVCTTDA